MAVNHEVAHQIITGMSFTDEGRKLVHDLEAMRYYHRDGLSCHLGDGSRLVISINEDPWDKDDNKMIGIVYIPGFKNGKPGHENLFINKASWPGPKTEAAIFWSFPEDTDEAWELIKGIEDVKNASFIEADIAITKAMRTPGAPTLIPRELAEWATDLIVNCSDWGEREAEDCRPVWREIIIKNPQGDRDGGPDMLNTLIKIPSAGIDWLILTTLDEDGTVREISIKSDDTRDVFARKLHQEKVMDKRNYRAVTEKPFADWEMELLGDDVKQWETAVQNLAETHCKYARVGRRILVRDLVNAAIVIGQVKPEDLGSLRTANIYDQNQKSAIRRVVAVYQDQDINNNVIEDDGSDDADTMNATFMHAFELFESMKKMLNMVTDYKYRDYFDSISPVQALVHLVNDNYEPHDIEF